MAVPTGRIRKYYDRVVKHLKKTPATWSRVVHLLGKGNERRALLDIWHIVRDILERLDEHGIDPEKLDWETLFENLPDFESKEMFLDYLESQGYIPMHKEKIEYGGLRRYEKEEMLPPTEFTSVAEFKKYIPKVEEYFISALLERGYSPTTARRYIPLLRSRVIDLILSDLEAGITYKWIDIERMIEDLADKIKMTRPPTPPVPPMPYMYPPFIRYGVEMTTEEREKYFDEFLSEIGYTREMYDALDAFTKAELEKDFIRWLSRKKFI